MISLAKRAGSSVFNCAMAQKLHVHAHHSHPQQKHCGIVSAVKIGLADVVAEEQVIFSMPICVLT